MVIEAVINGEVLTRSTVPDEYLQDMEGVPWKENAAFREQVVSLYLQAFRQRMEKFFQPGFQIDYRLVFPSKMNMLHEKDLIRSREDDQATDQRPEERDHRHAGGAAAGMHNRSLPPACSSHLGDPRYSGA